ncbi:hypothetical protein BGX31_010956 [Mortierella sp. GBA43]|nr:hypothetical protein BGX31_010956 [Mortierella sp. GBA43]
MPDHKVYIPQKQPILAGPPGSTMPPSRNDRPTIQPTTTKMAAGEPKVLAKGPTAPTAATVAVAEPSNRVLQGDRGISVSTVPSTAITSDSSRLVTSTITTPGAFPEAAAKPLARTTEEAAALKPNAGSRSLDVVEHVEAHFAEDLRSVSTKVGSTDSGSTRGERPGSKLDYLREQDPIETPTSLDEATDPAALDRYHREKTIDRYRYADEEATAQFRGEDRRRDMERDDLGAPILDDLYEDPYSPISGDQFSFYDDGDEGRLEDLRRYYDDDESQHSGSIPIRRDRGEFFASRARYDDRDYDRPYQHYSSSVPARSQYLSEREIEQPEWATGSETASIAGYAREQYPNSRDYAPRPTLEDREREFELNQQKTSGSFANGGTIHGAGVGTATGTTRSANDRRPTTAPGTVAHLRRRFSDQNVSDAGAAQTIMVNSQGQGPRPRGMSGSGVTNLQLDTVRRERDSRYPPRASTPQSRVVAASASRYERSIATKTVMSGSSGQLVGPGSTMNGRYSSAGGPDYDDSTSGRVSVFVGDQRARRR